MVRNRNACLPHASGEYIKWLHADDYLCSDDALKVMAEKLDQWPSAALVACPTLPVDQAGARIGEAQPTFTSSRFFSGTGVIQRCLRQQKNFIGGPSAGMFRRSHSARGFDEAYFHAADLEMWFHLLEQGCFGYIDEPLVAYRWHANQQTEKDRLTLTQANDWRGLVETYLSKPYIRMKREEQAFIVHETVRRTVRQCRKLRKTDESAALLESYGRLRYSMNAPWCFARRKLDKVRVGNERAEFLENRHLDLSQASAKPMGINVAGFFRGQYGIGESSRAICRAVSDCGIPSTRVNIQSKDHSNKDETVQGMSKDNPYGVNLMTFSFDYARRFSRDMGKEFFKGRHNIALWYWELERFPARWHSNFDYYDEIWAPSEFCCQALRAVSPVPIRKITYPLYPADTATGDRSAFGIPNDAFAFLFNFDFFSTLARKNPLGLIEAYWRAFKPGDNVVLVLKSINSEHDPNGSQQIASAIERLEGLPVRWIESHLSGGEMSALFSVCDCYVSLHRSEGLGLGMAQAMMLGKPVIGTGYSGNLEYMDSTNSLLVDYDVIELRENYGPASQPYIYEQGNVWAEPDIDHAATHMRWVFDHRTEAQQLGEKGRADISRRLSPETTQREIRQRVRELYGLPP